MALKKGRSELKLNGCAKLRIWGGELLNVAKHLDAYERGSFALFLLSWAADATALETRFWFRETALLLDKSCFPKASRRHVELRPFTRYWNYGRSVVSCITLYPIVCNGLPIPSRVFPACVSCLAPDRFVCIRSPFRYY